MPEQPPLLVIPGALGVADSGAEALGALWHDRRIIRFDYANDRSMPQMLERLLDAIDGASAEKADVIGFSVGGWFAQCLAAQAPRRVRKLVLAHSFVLEPAARWRFSAALRLWPLLPRALLRAGVQARARAALKPLKAVRPEVYDEVMRTTEAALRQSATFERLFTQQRLLRDSLSEPLPEFRAEMLIVDSSSDPLVPAKERLRLRRTYPSARHVDFPDAGHASARVAPTAFAEAVDRFLRSSDVSD